MTESSSCRELIEGEAQKNVILHLRTVGLCNQGIRLKYLKRKIGQNLREAVMFATLMFIHYKNVKKKSCAANCTLWRIGKYDYSVCLQPPKSSPSDMNVVVKT